MQTILDTIGNTPLIQCQRLSQAPEPALLLKYERSNPGGSIKDRPAKFMIEEAERRQLLRPGGTIIESSSGNFGISLAMIGAAKGYHVIILVDPKVTPSNYALLKSYGAEVIVVTQQDESGSYHKTRIALANELARSIPNAFRPDQCFNLLNSTAHYQQTARELLQSCPQIDIIIAAVSTGGQLGGIARYVKQHQPHIRIIGVDAQGSAIFGGQSHAYLMPGVGLSWTPSNLNLQQIDHAFKVSDADAFAACRAIARHEGILLGPSGGAVSLVGLHYAQISAPNTRIVCLIPDGGERYIATVFSDSWMQEHQLPLNYSIEQLRERAKQLQACDLHPTKTNTKQIERQLRIPESTYQFNKELLASEQFQTQA
jgi:2,3-diaminopropionate biosynthesis protein SbnA